MSVQKTKGKKNSYLGILGILFLVASLWVGTISVRQQQNIQEKAAVPQCPGAQKCPTSDGLHLLACGEQKEDDNSPADSVCAWVNRVEICGGVQFCCPTKNGKWTKDLTKCKIATPSPSPVPPTPSPSPVPPTPSPTVSACVGGNPNSVNRWDVNQDNTVNIIDIGLIIDNYGKNPSNDPRTDVNNDCTIDIVDIGILLDHYNI